MAENENVNKETPSGTEPPVGAEQPSGLPSDNIEVDYTPFELSDDIKGRMKDGKINGRFGSVDEVLAKLKEAEDRAAGLISESTKSEKAKEQEAIDAKAKADAQVSKQQTIMDMIPEFQANGMQLTPEMEAKAVEAGLDVRDIKIGAMELKQNVEKAHAVVGGKEEYSNMMAWAKENIDDAQKVAFDKDVTGGMSEYAIKGLHSDYTAATKDGYVPRIEGSAAVKGIQPYADRRSLYKDKDYIMSPAGKRDTQAIKNYKARLRVTPNSVIGI